ncbi:sugar-transfer associated ATP-grasp domain-containing protein [Proteinivorax hydrogeniformans]|uniref:acylphosphatase n=1 Tax=Proteinivorax hydrogeniformans TaxID=1826727 RepID=A0AAU8HWW6_9FIRM
MAKGLYKIKKNKKPNMLANLLIFSMFRRSDKNPADIIHKAYSIYYWRNSRTLKSRCKVVLAFLVSPFKISKDIFKWLRKVNTRVTTLHKCRIRQALEQFYLAYFFSINSENYYLQGFYQKDGLKRARRFVNKGALKNGVFKLLTTYGQYTNSGTEIWSLGNKVEFSHFCIQNDIPTVPVIMEFVAGGTVKYYTQDYSTLPEEDIFCKPNVDNEGKGAEVWFWEKGCFKSPKGKKLDKNQLQDRLKNLANKHICGSILVQPLILPHPELAAFRKNATPTIRVLSYVKENGDIEIDQAMLRFSIDSNSIVDNASAGGMVAPIEVASGKLSSAFYTNYKNIGKSVDDLNGTLISNKTIPHWNEVKELVARAHNLFRYRLIIGWDILITEDQPLVLEGNSQPGICFIQKAHKTSFGEMSIGTAVANYCQEAIKTLYNGKLEINGVQEKITHPLFKTRKTLTLKIYGKVQGVGYRKWLFKRAKELNINGWVQNTPDNAVRGVINGKGKALEDIVKLAKIGPKNAKVDSIEVSTSLDSVNKSFKILR